MIYIFQRFAPIFLIEKLRLLTHVVDHVSRKGILIAQGALPASGVKDTVKVKNKSVRYSCV